MRLQLDYIMVRQRYKTNVKNSFSYQGADVDSNHNMMIMKVSLKLKKVAIAKLTLKWNIEQLKTEEEAELMKVICKRTQRL